MVRILVIALAALSLTGCVTQSQRGDGYAYWKPDMDYGKRVQDINQCDYESTASAANVAPWNKVSAQRELMHKCMLSRGYQLPG